MKQQRSRKAKAHRAAVTRKRAKRRTKQQQRDHLHFAWVMSLPDGKTTLPPLSRRRRRFSRPVIDARARLFQAHSWIGREQQRQRQKKAG